MFLVILEDAACAHVRHVDAPLLTEKPEAQGGIQVVPNILHQLARLLQVVNGAEAWTMRATHKADNAIGDPCLEFSHHTGSVIGSTQCVVNLVSFSLQKSHHLRTNPTTATEEENTKRGGHVRYVVYDEWLLRKGLK